MRLTPYQSLLMAMLCGLAVWSAVIWFVAWQWFT